jgi:uracil-DNA glycosylase
MNRVSDEVTRAVFDDAHAAYAESSHPCNQFRRLQHGVPDERWQLPVPFIGRTANAGLVFLGQNPNYDSHDVPTIATDYEQWRSFYEASFDVPQEQWPLLYRRYQRIGVGAVGQDFHLGADGLVLEIIRFRSESSEGCDDPRVLKHEWPLTLAMLRDIQPRAIVANGQRALDALCAVDPGLASATEAPRLEALEGRSFLARLEGLAGPVAVIPTRHLTGTFGLWNATIDRLGETAQKALASR